MGVSFDIALFSLLAIVLPVSPQVYGQYGYPPYGQYYSGQNAVYSPYPYQYVSSQSNSYLPYYGYPVQSYPQNYPVNYPAYTYPVQSYPSQPVQTNYQYTYPQYTPTQASNTSQVDPYANLKVNIIDVEPKYFDYYKRFFKLENNAYPIEVIDDTSGVGAGGGGGGGGVVEPQTQGQPYYTVKTESKNFNFSSIPQSINTHDVKSKTYSFKRTFTVDPSKKGNNVINLNFVNGVQVTEEALTEGPDQADATIPPAVTEEAISTTTENEEPVNILTWR